MIVLMQLIRAVHHGVKFTENHEVVRQLELYVPSKAQHIAERLLFITFVT